MRENRPQSTRAIYNSCLFNIGIFRSHPDDYNFHGPHINGGYLLVFPRTSVLITHAGQEAVVADPTTVMFYNNGQIYERDKLAEQGDACEWFAFAPRLIRDAIRAFDPSVDDRPCQPFQFTHGSSDTHSYLWQRLIVEHILENKAPDRLLVEETALFTLKQVIENNYRRRGMLPLKSSASIEKDVAEDVRKLLSTRYYQDLSLEQISKDLTYSPFHLCRVFRKHTGHSIHQYLKQIRLRTSLEYVTQPNADLTRVAMQLGFSSHSHFTAAFRKTFGAPPSALRNTSKRQVAEWLSKISIA